MPYSRIHHSPEEYAILRRRACNKYEKTRAGFIMRAYRNMKSRVKGVQKTKLHLYEGKDLIGKNAFYRWAMSDAAFNDLFDDWKASGHERKLTPSVDRIDPQSGYHLGNMEWVTFSENCRRGGKWKPSQAMLK